MKLIIKEYLASLKERGELDAVIPDLLSQLGLNVYSRPTRGTRQDGVDVGAVGSLDGGTEKVYLFSIKPGNLTRRDWDGDAAQSLRPSLNEIIDSYIPNRLPAEHRGKDIVICIAVGGDIHESVRAQVTGFVGQNTRDNISFEEWNGDKLAAYIQSSFLREDLLPETSRAHLRKSLAMLDEPDVSYRHFVQVIRLFSAVDDLDDARRVTAMRQMSICLWILYGWARDAENMEAPYRAAELTLLHAWSITKLYLDKDSRASEAMVAALSSIFTAYSQISHEFLHVNVMPHAQKRHAVSSALRGQNSLDVNLKLFDLLGRLGASALWAHWGAQIRSDQDEGERESMAEVAVHYSEGIKALINNNPVLLLPSRDEQVIDISIAVLALIAAGRNQEFILSWLGEMLAGAKFAYEAHAKYPSVLRSYIELLEHPKQRDDEYRARATSASVLFPFIAFIAALLDENLIYESAGLMQKLMRHCTYQFWYPDETSEENLYRNDDTHGAALADISLDVSAPELLAQVFRECDETKHFAELSACKFGWWPLIIIACRHYRLPLPPHLFMGLRKHANEDKHQPTA